MHIAMGKDSLFGEPRPAKASVVLKLRGSAQLLGVDDRPASRNLVAASVEGLRPEAVVILDSFGRPLARPREDDDDRSARRRLERQQRIERELARTRRRAARAGRRRRPRARQRRASS